GQTKGVSTDAFGNFSINASVGAPLNISYVGYKVETVNASQGMTVYLQPTTEVLDQLVVVGYGVQKKADLTGAVSTVDVPRVMDSRPVQDVTKALQGNIPGLTITTTDGSIWTDASVKIRGVGTLSNGQESAPLIVVDGVAVDNLNFVNPEDIADISVLKDAASSSIYGARAAFGVLLITTKTADKKDKVSLRYNNNFAWSQATYLPTFANAVDEAYAALQANYRGMAAAANTEVGNMPYAEILPYLEAWYAQHNGKLYTDYRELRPYQGPNDVGDYRLFEDGSIYKYAQWDVKKLAFNNAAPSQKHNVSLEGQSGRTNYRLSFGYDHKQGLENFNPEKMTRYMANVNVSTEIFSWLKAGAIVNWTQREYTDPNLVMNTYQYLWRWNSFIQAFGWINDENGAPRGFRNPLTDRMNAHIDKQTDRQTRLQAWMQATLFKDLVLRGEFNYDVRTSKQNDGYTPLTVWDWSGTFQPYTTPTQATSFARTNRWDSDRWTMNIYATYDHMFPHNNHLKVMLGSQAERYSYDYFQLVTRGLIDYDLVTPNLTDGGSTGYIAPTISRLHRATAGFFGRINYDWNGIWLVELNGRYDGSSRFPAAHQWAFFPSGSAGYRFSEEKYFSPLRSWWSNGKLRASIGSIGNEAVGDNVFISTVSKAGKANWIGTTGQLDYWNLPGVVSSNLTWERVTTYDVGLDLGFLNNALNVSFDWYRRDTNDMLAQGEVLPTIFGASNALTNAGSLRTDGWELSLNWNHSFGDANIYATFMIADARTKVTKISNPAGTIYQAIPYNTDRGRFYEGQYVGDIWGFEFDRFFTVDDFTWNTADGKWAAGARQTGYAPGVASQAGLQTGAFIYGPGDVKFKDLDGDGVITNGSQVISDHGDAKVIGNMMPRYEYSLRIGGAWKGFDIDMFFQGVGKRNVWNVSSNVVPFAQTAAGLFAHQLDYNSISYDTDANGNRYVTGYNVDQNNLYPVPYGPNFSFGTWQTMFGQGVNNFLPSSRYLTNMAYLRFKTLTVGYTIPYYITRHALIQNARIYFSAENLCMLYNGAKKFGIDPEIFGGDNGSGSMGVASFGRTYPMPKSFSFGIQVTF
ncbi:MAG: SusC/RagA family TonB-linked outer membrane protein, partial [Muribaculaceae bacterium]|nr:SusC/RagA family TonB-linked outer membrane protein [Muribaculaceae bacterium]